MIKRYSIILSFILVTLLVTGAVELSYNYLGKRLLGNKEIGQAETRPVSKTVVRQGSTGKTARGKEDYTIINKRNLFGKVPQKTKQRLSDPEPVLTTTTLDLRLLGTIGGAEKEQRAIIQNKKNNSQKIYHRGDAIEHALIKEVGRGMIVLSVDGKDEVLLMEETKSPPSTNTSLNNSIPDVYSLSDTNELENEPEALEQMPPAVTPKRRMTLKPKKPQVTEP